MVKSVIENKYEIWLTISIATAILFSFSGLKIAFSSPYIVQDDARQYIFWMQQFSDPELFANDLIANYFQSVTPVGFINLYRFVSSLAIDIFWFNKISTLILCITTTIYCFLVCIEIFPVPFAGFLSSLLINQNLWMVDDLSSGTPRAYIYVLLLAFIYYLLKNKLIPCLITIVLQGLFYPVAVLISITVLFIRILRFQKLSKVGLYGLFTGILILVIYSLQISEFAPIVTVNEAKVLPEFLPQGRSAFFTNSFTQFWLTDRRSGLFPIEWQYSLMCAYGIGLWWLKQLPDKFPLVKKIDRNIAIIGELAIASILLFFLAHILLFKLHLPGRYTHHTSRIIIALIDGITLAIVFQRINVWLRNKINKNYVLWQLVSIILLLSPLLYPTYAIQSYPERLGYVRGESPQLYQFLQQQPKDIRIATLSKEANFIPSLAARSVLVAEEYAIPYHRGYYKQISQRVRDLITVQYSNEKSVITSFIQQYNINLFIIDRQSWNANYLESNPWLQQFEPEIDRAIKDLENKQNLILKQYSDLCNIFQTKDIMVIDSDCILKK